MTPKLRALLFCLSLFLCVLVLMGGASALSGGDSFLLYEFSTGSGTNVPDLSGNGNTATLNNAGYNTTFPSYEVNGSGSPYAAQLTGQTDSEVQNTSASYPSTTAWTLATWVRVDEYNTGGSNARDYLFDFSNSSVVTTRHLLALNNGGDIEAYDGTGFIEISTTQLSIDTYYHACYVVDDTSATLYIDGSQYGSSITVTAHNLADMDEYSYGGGVTAQDNTKGKLDTTQLFDYALTEADCQELTDFGPSSSPSIANATLTADDVYTSASLSNFSIRIREDGSALAYDDYSTTNGTIVLPILTNSSSLWEIRYNSNESGGYFERVYFGVNLSTTHTAELHQAELTFNASNRVSGASVTDFRVNTSSNGGSADVTDTDPTLNLTAANGYTFEFSKAGWYTAFLSDVNVSALQQSTETFSVYDHKLNVTIDVLSGSSTDQNFTADVYGRDSLDGFHEQSSTTNGEIIFNLTDGNYTVYINDSIHTLESANVTLNSSVNFSNLEIEIFTTNTINITFRDEETLQVIDDRDVTAFFTGDIQSYNETTDNGTMFLELLEPQDYIITYSAEGYDQREYSFTLTNRTTNDLVLYLLNTSQSTIITTTVVNTVGQTQDGVVVNAQKKNLSGTNYFRVESCTTNDVGECILHLELNDVTYRFTVSKDGVSQTFSSTGSTVSEDQRIFSSDLRLVIDTGTDTVTDSLEQNRVTGSVTYSNASQTFTYTWNDPVGLDITSCLLVERRNGANTFTVNQTCSSGASGTITQSINESTGDSFTGTGYVIIDGSRLVIDTFTVVTSTFAQDVGLFGIFLFGFIIAGIAAFTGLWNPVVGPTLLVVTTFLAGYLGFVTIGMSTMGVVASLLVLVIYLVKS